MELYVHSRDVHTIIGWQLNGKTAKDELIAEAYELWEQEYPEQHAQWHKLARAKVDIGAYEVFVQLSVSPEDILEETSIAKAREIFARLKVARVDKDGNLMEAFDTTIGPSFIAGASRYKAALLLQEMLGVSYTDLVKGEE